MLEKIKHVNSVGEVIDSYSSHIYMNYNDLRDFAWKTKIENDRIVGFEKGIAPKTIPFYIVCQDKKEANDIKNKFFEHFEIDILNQKAGYFEINGYRLYCYAIKNKKSEYLYDKGYLKLSVEFTSDEPNWQKQTSYILNQNALNKSTDANAKKYTYSYPYKYRTNKSNLKVVNTALGTSDIIIRMFGPCSNPFVNINDTVYKINVSVENNEYIEIDTERRTIYKHSEFGDKTNLFNSRSKDRSDFFKKVSSGELIITSSDIPSVEVVILERRSEPKWD